PGDTVPPGGELFTLAVTSESLLSSQTELYKNAEETRIAQAQYKRLEETARAGGVPEQKLIDSRVQLDRLAAARRAQRTDLATRGLTPEQIDQVEQGRFLKEITIRAPAVPNPLPASPGMPGFLYEVEKLKVQGGEQVQAGQTLCYLANHEN